MKPRVLWILGSVLLASCGYTVPYQVSGPVTSKEGVQVRLLGDRCFVNRSGEQYPTTVGDDRLDVEVSLQVDNASAQPAQLSLGRIQLAGGSAPDTVVMLASEARVVSLSPGETRRLGLDFETQTMLGCRRPFALEVRDAVAIDGKPVALDPIRFQPAR
jgi:hypothetical protein